MTDLNKNTSFSNFLMKTNFTTSLARLMAYFFIAFVFGIVIGFVSFKEDFIQTKDLDYQLTETLKQVSRHLSDNAKINANEAQFFYADIMNQIGLVMDNYTDSKKIQYQLVIDCIKEASKTSTISNQHMNYCVSLGREG